MCKVRAELKHPIAPLLNSHAHSPPTLHCDRSERIILRQLNHQLYEDIIDSVSRDHLPRGRPCFHLGEKKISHFNAINHLSTEHFISLKLSTRAHHHVLKSLGAGLYRGDLLCRQNAADVLAGEFIHRAEDTFLLAVPPQTHHCRQVLQRTIVHRAGQMGNLKLQTFSF